MATERPPFPLTLDRLRYELLFYPPLVALKSLAVSTLISRCVFGVTDWRAILICSSSDVLAMALDHYFDQSKMQSYAIKSGDRQLVMVFHQARALLFSCAASILSVLVRSPPSTSLMVAIFFGPAFLWDVELARLGGKCQSKSTPGEKNEVLKKGFRIKRIPWMKPVIVGVIRGCGTFAVVNSILAPSRSPISLGVPSMWSATQIVLWIAFGSFGHTTMGDIRDFHADQADGIPTIPVLLGSIFHTKLILTGLHLVTMFLYYYNPYIMLAVLYDLAFVWLLDESSPPWCFPIHYQSPTVAAAVYGAVEIANLYTRYPGVGPAR